eukprot:542080-Lingulodinium_polyedra.AAC.1
MTYNVARVVVGHGVRRTQDHDLHGRAHMPQGEALVLAVNVELVVAPWVRSLDALDGHARRHRLRAPRVHELNNGADALARQCAAVELP